MSATPASFAIASRDVREVALAQEDVGDLADALDEDERAHLAERVVQRVQHREEEDRRARHGGAHVAQHVDLRPPRPLRAVAQLHGDAAGLQRRAHRAAHVDVRMAAVPAALLALRLQPALELRHDAVHGCEVLERAARQRAVELVERPLGRQRLRALDLLALELAAQQLLEPAQLVARQPVAAGIVLVEVRLGLGAQAERTADALHVDADDPRPLALAAERRDGQPREVAQRGLRAVAQRRGDLLAQRVEVHLVEVRPAARRAVGLLDAGLDRRRLGGAEEEAVEDELEDRAGPRATSRASPTAPPGSPPGPSTRPRRAPRSRRAAPRSPRRRPPSAAPRRTRRVAPRCPGGAEAIRPG